jgi:hypothetical protein
MSTMMRPSMAASPLFRFTSTPPAEPSEREGYAVAESIMRSATRAKRGERPQSRRNRVRPAGAAR